MSASTASGSAPTWAELLNESVHTSDDQDIGDIEAEFVVIKKGFVNMHQYFIPADKVEGWDGNVLWLRLTEDEVKKRYQNDDATPDHSRYLTKDYANYEAYGMYPPFGLIPTRYAVPTYPVPTTPEQPVTYKRDLCGTTFRDGEFSEHVRKSH